MGRVEGEPVGLGSQFKKSHPDGDSDAEEWALLNMPAMPVPGSDGVSEGRDSEPSDVTRLLSAAAHVRPAAGGQRRAAKATAPVVAQHQAGAPQWMMFWRDKDPKPHEDESEQQEAAEKAADPPVLGFDYVRWVRERIAGVPWPVPSHGFDLGAVFAHCVRSEQLRRERDRLMVLALLVAVLWGWLVSAWWSPAVALVGVWLAFYMDRVRAGRMLREAMDLGQIPVSTPIPLSSRDRRTVERIRKLEGQPVIPYQNEARSGPMRHHFVGAGRVWHESNVGIDVMPALSRERAEGAEAPSRLPERVLPSIERIAGRRGSADDVKPFTPDDLLNHVGAELQRAIDPLAQGRLTHFHPTSRQDIFGVATLSADRWPGMDRQQWRSLVTLAHEGVRDPRARRAPKVARRFLCARMVSWDGELVACIFVGVAYENYFLRLIVRPQVMTPLDPRIRETIESQMKPGRWEAHRSCLALAAEDVGRALVRPLQGRLAAPVPAGDTGAKVVSLREAYAIPFMDDMLQDDDARRYIAMMSGRVFGSVEGFLMDHNVDLTSFQAQINVLINQGIMAGGDVVNSPVQSGNTNSTIE